ncbi:uncharacterized protein [Miscanthus floridulus]|uniref:uncharacterized protein n=1 Tax=Miscanthus floridulus TaxID=154761 RepID=UPI0034596034
MGSGWRGILGFDYAIVQAPLGPNISGPELAAAVANAGAIGLIRLPDFPAPDYVRELIRKTRGLTSRPFGAAIVLPFLYEEDLRVVLEEKLAVLQVYCGEFPREWVQEAHRAGVKVLHQFTYCDMPCVDSPKVVDLHYSLHTCLGNNAILIFQEVKQFKL